MSIEKNNLQHPPALLIGTPGRIRDHIEKNRFRTDSILTLVIDEFDKSLEFGFEEDMRYIISQLTSLKKKVLISATQAIEIPEFVETKNAITINFLHQKENAPKLVIKKVVVQKSVLDTLFHLLCTLREGSVLVFCNFKEKVEEVHQYLKERELENEFFHGGLDQKDREKALIKFRNGSVNILITSDLASRGLDIPEIKNIIHVQLPQHEDAFIHRNGRTARMNADGMALIITENNSFPEYVDRSMETFEVNYESELPAPPQWTTLYFGKGKKDKLNKVDLVGFLGQKGGLKKEEIGLLEVKDYFSYAAIKSTKLNEVLKKIRDEKIKNMNAKIEVCK